MKKVLLISAISFFAFACTDSSSEPAVENSVTSAPVSNEAALTTIQWIDSSKNLGKINEGQKVNISFRFKNSGDKPLVIQSVQPGCGCTVADYPKEPIAPGAEAEITGAFDSQGREGLQHKQITVTANTIGSSTHQVEFVVEVVKAKV